MKLADAGTVADLSDEDVQYDKADEDDGEDDEEETELHVANGALYAGGDGLDDDFDGVEDEDIPPGHVIDEDSLRHAHVRHHRSSLTRKVSDELNKGFRGSQHRIGSANSQHQTIAEQKQARSLKLRLQGQVCLRLTMSPACLFCFGIGRSRLTAEFGQARTIQELERKLEQTTEELSTKDEMIDQLRRRVATLDNKLLSQQSQPVFGKPVILWFHAVWENVGN